MEAIILIILALFFALALCNNRPECFGTDPHEGGNISPDSAANVTTSKSVSAMTCEIGRVIEGRPVWYIRTGRVGWAVACFMELRRVGAAVRLRVAG